MEKKDIYNKTANNIRLIATELLGDIYNLKKQNVVTNDELERVEQFFYELYKISNEIEKK